MGSLNGYTGHLFEEEVIGRCRVRTQGYLKWRQAADMARKSQPQRKTPTARKLERLVSMQVGEEVKFFTAIGTPFDFFHGVDGFFEFHGVVVTIDVTMNPCKDCGKADLIVHADDFEDLAVLAGRIAREMQFQLSRRA